MLISGRCSHPTDERYFLSQGARAVLRYLQQAESRITDAEARVTRSQQSLVTKLSKELTRGKATLARKRALLVEQQQLNHRLALRIRELERALERVLAGKPLPLETAPTRDLNSYHLRRRI